MLKKVDFISQLYIICLADEKDEDEERKNRNSF